MKYTTKVYKAGDGKWSWSILDASGLPVASEDGYASALEADAYADVKLAALVARGVARER